MDLAVSELKTRDVEVYYYMKSRNNYIGCTYSVSKSTRCFKKVHPYDSHHPMITMWNENKFK